MILKAPPKSRRRQQKMRMALKRWRKRKTWGQRFRRVMLERARATKVLRLVSQQRPYCLAPDLFTWAYLRRSKLQRLRDQRAVAYLRVIVHLETRRDRRAWDPTPP